jgi:hypothetical protein
LDPDEGALFLHPVFIDFFHLLYGVIGIRYL